MEDDLKEALGDISDEQRKSNVRFNEFSSRLDGMHEKVSDVHRGIYGSNGNPGIAGKVQVHDEQIKNVRGRVKLIEETRWKIIVGVVLSFCGAVFAWARNLIPGTGG